MHDDDGNDDGFVVGDDDAIPPSLSASAACVALIVLASEAAAAAAAVLLWHLGAYGLWESTEARYAEIAARIGLPPIPGSAGPVRDLTEAREVAQMLGRWDGNMGVESQGAAVYHVLMEHLVDELFRERFEEGGEVAIPWVDWERTTARVARHSRHGTRPLRRGTARRTRRSGGVRLRPGPRRRE